MADTDRSETIANFIAITSSTDAEATQFLEMSNWELESAVNLKMSMGDAPPSPPKPPPVANDRSRGSASVPAPRPSLESTSAALAKRLQEEEEQAAAGSGRRAPDKTKTDQLIDGGEMNLPLGMGMVGGSIIGMRSALSDLESVDWMFPPPTDSMFYGGYAEARAKCKAERRWLLVNIQRPTEFASHALNRDTWSSDLIKAMLSSQLLLWQQIDTAPDGSKYCQQHAVDLAQLPHIGIVDPRTGQLVRHWSGKVEPQDLVDELLAFFAEAPPLESDTPFSPGRNQARASAGAGAAAAGDDEAGDAANNATGDDAEQHGSAGGSRVLAAAAAATTAAAAAATLSTQGQNKGVGADVVRANEDEDEAALQAALAMSLGGIDIAGDARGAGQESGWPEPDSAAVSASNVAAGTIDSTTASASSSASTSTSTSATPGRVSRGWKPSSALMDAIKAEAGSSRVQLRLPNNQAVVHRFSGTDHVEALYCLAWDRVEGAKERDFDLCQAFPRKSLEGMVEATLEDAQLLNSSIIFRWLDD